MNSIENHNVSLKFEDLVSEYKERLYWHIRRMVISHEDADDVLQNTFIKVFKNLNNFQGDSQVYTWLYRIATNECLTFINKRNRTTHLSNEDLQESLVTSLTSDPYFDGDEAQLKLQQAIDTLPTKQKQVFVMKYFDELQYNEISEILGTSEGALKANYHYAVKKITEYVTDN
ncbi:RNA polymerase sigma factor [Leeuwenhoekiella marinoflava]|uniref:RNA polymerase sigma factor n=2 Tax=Leeuwenhoekiella marinoflava TaxID=988 RepID=A0A4Q0PIW1_9FLAO|nr:RNA polymerase sigma factor [Leeuwenhoekiella marinoflava]RXG27205.1 RNA polymerase sigma-70 factor (ECF subfamily) [Leeuwenhoekiella marinoflava]SHF78635.1 RNA polymerase sigma-70 factor, ECF subfamily [Leeuwenhoekiella marinoflava DSM 3653]